MGDKTGLYVFLWNVILDSLYVFFPVGLSNAKQSKIGSLTPLTILPFLKSQFEWILPLMGSLMGIISSLWLRKNLYESLNNT